MPSTVSPIGNGEIKKNGISTHCPEMPKDFSANGEYEDLRCGYGTYRPKWMQVFNTPQALLVFLSFAAFVQGKTKKKNLFGVSHLKINPSQLSLTLLLTEWVSNSTLQTKNPILNPGALETMIHFPNPDASVEGLKIRCFPCWGVTTSPYPTKKGGCPGYDTVSNGEAQILECRVPLHCNNSQVHSVPERTEYLLGFQLLVKCFQIIHIWLDYLKP